MKPHAAPRSRPAERSRPRCMHATPTAVEPGNSPGPVSVPRWHNRPLKSIRPGAPTSTRWSRLPWLLSGTRSARHLHGSPREPQLQSGLPMYNRPPHGQPGAPRCHRLHIRRWRPTARPLRSATLNGWARSSYGARPNPPETSAIHCGIPAGCRLDLTTPWMPWPSSI